MRAVEHLREAPQSRATRHEPDTVFPGIDDPRDLQLLGLGQRVEGLQRALPL
jgi:hypothetical protein